MKLSGLFGLTDSIKQIGRYGKLIIGGREIIQIRLPGTIRYRHDPLDKFLGEPKRTFNEYIELINNAAKDNVVAGIMLTISNSGLDFAEIGDLRKAFLRFKEKGKSIYVYFEGGGNKEYLLASCGDYILGSKTSGVHLVGVKASAIYIKGFLDKLGVKVWTSKEGIYKTAGDMFTNEFMSEADKEQLGELVYDIFNRLIESISNGRQKSIEEVRAIIERGPLTPSMAERFGLYDSVGYKDDLKEVIKEREPYRVSFVKFNDYRKRRLIPFDNPFKKKIAVVYLSGMILPDDAFEISIRRNAIFQQKTEKMLKEIEKDSSIDAVLVRIDSPGGFEGPTDQIWRALSNLRKKKPVIVSTGGVCASGGYYIACAGDKVFAHPDSIVGSIGVIYMKLDISGLGSRLGINEEVIKEGEHADLTSPWRGFTEQEMQMIHAHVHEMYETFVNVVAKSRDMRKEDINNKAKGRIYSGKSALAAGLVDRLGGYWAALSEAKGRIGLKEDDDVNIVTYPKEKGLFEALASRPILGLLEKSRFLKYAISCGYFISLVKEGDGLMLWPVMATVE